MQGSKSKKRLLEKGNFHIIGKIAVEDQVKIPADTVLTAYAYDARGQLLGTGRVDAKGGYDIAARLSKPTDVQVVIGPAGDPKAARKSTAPTLKLSAKEWKQKDKAYYLQADLTITEAVVQAFLPWRICVSGHVRKIHGDDGTLICPVPFVKVEIFDVDREWCLWPYIKKWWRHLLDRPIFEIPELLKEPPFPPEPFPGPDPIGPVIDAQIRPINPVEAAGINPQPEPPRWTTMLGPQPEPPDQPVALKSMQTAQAAFERVGEARMIDPALASRLDNLTLTSKVAPWRLLPLCFYSKELVCETITDENGYFRCCFRWWPFHFRRGRLRFDLRPDIIIKVTQVIDGLETVIYMDPYTSTRWNTTSAHIDLYLNNEDIECGDGDDQERPEGSQVFFTRVGDTEVYKINQASGLYEEPPLSNLAYGGNLAIYGQFGDDVSDGSPARYYRLSCAKHGSSDSAFVPITRTLRDTRVNKTTNFSESYALGPKTVNGVPSLYEVRNFEDYLWYHPDRIGTWISWLTEPDTGKYVLRLEIFDENGGKLTSADIDYRDGTTPPNGVLNPMTDQCDLVITLDNKAPSLDLQIPAVINPCGVIPWDDVPPLDFIAHVSQENGRLHRWRLQYTKGISPVVHVLDGAVSNTGTPASLTPTVSGAPLLVGLTSTCAFALKLWARSHITDGLITSTSGLPRMIYYREIIKAVTIEKCEPCPPCE